MAFENTNVVRRDNKLILKTQSALGDPGVIEVYSDDETTKVAEITAAGIFMTGIYQDVGKTKLMTVPDTASDTLAAIAAAQTLTNKTVDSSANTLKNVVLNYTGVVTTAEINAGKTLIAAVAGRTLKVLRYFMLVNGAYDGGGGVSVILQDTNGTPVVITTAATAALTTGAKISSEVAVANVTDGAGMRANLTADKGIAIPADAAISGGTDITVSIDYMLV